MIEDASKAHAGELAIDGAALTGKPDLAVEWTHLLARLDEAGQIVREVGGRCWLAYVECDLEDVATIMQGDLQAFLRSGTIAGGAVMVVLMVACPEGRWRDWLGPAVEYAERRTKALLSAGILGDRLLVRPTPAARSWKPAKGKPWIRAARYDEALPLFYGRT